jgi:hypothetical protein
MKFGATAAAMVIVVTGTTSVHAAPVILVSGGLTVTDAMTCHVVNTGKNTVELITVAVVPLTQPENATSSTCEQVVPGGGCPTGTGGGAGGDYYCKVTISKGSKKDFRAVFCDVTSGSCSEAR